jgi:hypothetical protein
MDVQQQLWEEGQPAAGYEAPRIEVVLTPEELEREVLYAGQSSLVG